MDRPGVVDGVARLLDRAGVISVDRLGPTADLAWPRVVTGFAMMSKQTADLAMVGLAVGATGAAGLAFAYAYWSVAGLLALGLAGGTVTLVSQNYGADEDARAALAVKVSFAVAAALGIPITAGYVLLATPLVDLLGSDPAAVRHGAVYLAVSAPGVFFEIMNRIASRTYAGVSDTYTPMVARGGGAAINIVLSGVLIFGLGMGVAGAAIGTAVATAVVTGVLAWGLLGRRYGVLRMSPSPVPVGLAEGWFDRKLSRQLVEIAAPEMARKLAQGLVLFPLLWIAAAFGPVVVAGFEIGRRLRSIINSANWGFSIASSTLVGQHLGAGDVTEAGAYGASIIRLSTLVHVVLAVAVVALAPWIAQLFVSDPAAVATAGTFVALGAVSSVGYGVDGAASGALLGAGDTRLPFLAALLGQYAFALPAAFAGLVTPLGVVGLYLALQLETYVPAAINYWLFRIGRWKAVSRRYRPASEPS